MNLKITLNGGPVDPDLFQPLTVGALGTPPRPSWMRVETLTTTKQIEVRPLDPDLRMTPEVATALSAAMQRALTAYIRTAEDRLLDNRPFFDVSLRADGELIFTHNPLLPGAP